MREFKIDTNICIGETYLMTTKMKATSVSQYQPDTVVVDDYAYESRKISVTSIEDRGEYLYVGYKLYKPQSYNSMTFGYTKVYKNRDTAPKFGVVGFEKVFGNDEETVAEEVNQNNTKSTELRELQKTEAIKRLKELRVHQNVINEFIEEGKLNLSENGMLCWLDEKRQNMVNLSENAMLYWLDENQQKMIKDFESKYDAVVYHVIHNFTKLGELFSLLYVSKYTEEWDRDMEDLKYKNPFVYVVNVTIPEYSEFGCIGIKPQLGGVIRTA